MVNHAIIVKKQSISINNNAIMMRLVNIELTIIILDYQPYQFTMVQMKAAKGNSTTKKKLSLLRRKAAINTLPPVFWL